MVCSPAMGAGLRMPEFTARIAVLPSTCRGAGRSGDRRAHRRVRSVRSGSRSCTGRTPADRCRNHREHRAQQRRRHRVERLRPPRATWSRLVFLNRQTRIDAVGGRRDRGGVGHRQQRRRVDQHDVVLRPQLAEQPRHLLRGEQLAGVRRAAARWPARRPRRPTSAAPPGPARPGRRARWSGRPNARGRAGRQASAGAGRPRRPAPGWPAEASAMARFASVVVLPSLGIELVMTMTLRGRSTSTNCRLVRSCRNASARGDCGSSCTVSGRFGTCGSKAMTPRFGALGDVAQLLRRLDRGVERVAQPGPRRTPMASPATQAERQQHRQARRRRLDRRAPPAGPRAPRPAAAHRGTTGRSSSSTRRVRRCPTALAMSAARFGRPVGHADVDEHRVDRARGGDPFRQVVRGLGQPQVLDHLLAHPRAADQLHVGLDPLLGQLGALERRARGVGRLRRDVHRQRGRVLRRSEEPDPRRAAQPEDDRGQDDDPAFPQHPQVVVEGHVASIPVIRRSSAPAGEEDLGEGPDR